VASSVAEIEVDLIMPPSEQEDLHNYLRHNQGPKPHHDVWRALEGVHIEEAKASVEDDRKHILHMIKDEGPGYSELNSIVADYLKNWIVEKAATAVTDEECDKCFLVFQKASKYCRMCGTKRGSITTMNLPIRLCINVSALLGKVGKKTEARDILLQVWDSRKHTLKDHSTKEHAELLTQIGDCHGKLGDVQPKLDAFDQAKAIFKRLDETHDGAYASLLINIGWATHEQGKHDEALKVYEEVKQIHRETDGVVPHEGEMIKLFMNMGVCHLEKAKKGDGSFDTAIAAFDEAKTMNERRDVKPPIGSAVLKYYGDALCCCEHLSEALHMYDEAYRYQETLRESHTPQRANLLDSMAIAEFKSGNTTRMLEHFENAWEIRQSTSSASTSAGKRLTKHIVETANSMLPATVGNVTDAALHKRLGWLVRQVGDPRLALKIFTNVRAALEESHGLRSCDGAAVLSATGRLKGELGDKVGKMEDLNHARQIFEDTHSLETSEGIDLLILLGWAKSEDGDQRRALEDYNQARDIASRISTESAHLMMNIGVAKMRMGDFKEAHQDLQRAKEIREKQGKPADAVLKYIGDLYAQEKKFDEAKKTYKKALKILDKSGKLNRPEHAKLLLAMARAKDTLSQLGDQKKLLQEAWAVRNKTRTLNTHDGQDLEKFMRELNMEVPS